MDRGYARGSPAGRRGCGWFCANAGLCAPRFAGPEARARARRRTRTRRRRSIIRTLMRTDRLIAQDDPRASFSRDGRSAAGLQLQPLPGRPERQKESTQPATHASVSVYDSLESLDALRPEWEALLEEYSGASPF